MKYYKTYKDRTDAQRLAEMLQMQEQNQSIGNDFSVTPPPTAPSYDFISPETVQKMQESRKKRAIEATQKIGNRTFDKTTKFSTGGLA